MACLQMIGGDPGAINLPAQRHDAGIVAHRLARVLFAPIRHRGTDDEIFESRSIRRGDLEGPEQAAEESDSSGAPVRQFR